MKASTGLWARCSRILDTVETALAYAGGLGLVFVTLSTTFDVALRRASDYGAPWVVEISEFAMVSFTFLAAPWILRHNGHVTLDTFIERVSPATQRWFRLVGFALTAVSLVVVAWAGIATTQDYLVRNLWYENILKVPRWLVLLPIPVGTVLLFLECGRKLVQTYAGGDTR